MLLPVDIWYIADQLVDLGDELQRAFEEAGFRPDQPPDVLLTALDCLLDTFRAADSNSPAESAQAIRDMTGSEPESLLQHGLHLLRDLSELALSLNLAQQSFAIQQLSLPLCCWVLRRGGELVTADPVIGAAEKLVDEVGTADQGVELFGLLSEIMNGIGMERGLEWEAEDPARPWRALLLCRANAAICSLQIRLIEEAFDSIATFLPEEAAAYFRDCMGLVESGALPMQLHEVTQQYFQRWSSGQRLH